MQNGFQYHPDGRANYPFITDREIVDNFSLVKIGMDYHELERTMNAFIPVDSTDIRANDVRDTFRFRRTYDEHIIIYFIFVDGKLVDKRFSFDWERFLPETDISVVDSIRKGMSYNDVRDIFGVDGYGHRAYISYGELIEEFAWIGSASDGEANITFTDGRIRDEDDITIY
jgi:hypothetical protein